LSHKLFIFLQCKVKHSYTVVYETSCAASLYLCRFVWGSAVLLKIILTTSLLVSK
jgi:hypothetical protein